METAHGLDKDVASPGTPLLTKNNRCREILGNRAPHSSGGIRNTYSPCLSFNSDNLPSNRKLSGQRSAAHVGRKDNIPCLLKRQLTCPVQENSVLSHPSNMNSTKNMSSTHHLKEVAMNNDEKLSELASDSQNDLSRPMLTTLPNDGENVLSEKSVSSLLEKCPSIGFRNRLPKSANNIRQSCSSTVTIKETDIVLSNNVCPVNLNSSSSQAEKTSSINQYCTNSSRTYGSINASKGMVSITNCIIHCRW